MILDQTVEVAWCSKNKKHYIDKGYLFTKMGDKFNVDVFDLIRGSQSKVAFSCDICGIVKSRKYSSFKNRFKDHWCFDCNKRRHEISFNREIERQDRLKVVRQKLNMQLVGLTN